jgi:dolichol-phosphate mannosyltransferase
MKRKKNCTVGVVIPAYRVRAQILSVLNSLGPRVDQICVVDDACPEKTGQIVEQQFHDKRVTVLYHPTNQGVGAAMKTGFKELLLRDVDVIVKLDGDGQMDPTYINDLVDPIVNGLADYTKGNRFRFLEGIHQMPKIRYLGNIGLSFLSKASTGYWNLFDPNNGFVAISNPVLRQINLEKVSQRYFFESDMLFRLGLMRAKVLDIPMKARYGNEKSNLSVLKASIEFPLKHLKNLIKRIFLVYFVKDFSFPSLQLILGTLLTFSGATIGLYNFSKSQELGMSTAPGTLILFVVLFLTGVQLLLGFISHDLQSVPNRTISQDLRLIQDHPTGKDYDR